MKTNKSQNAKVTSLTVVTPLVKLLTALRMESRLGLTTATTPPCPLLVQSQLICNYFSLNMKQEWMGEAYAIAGCI